MKDLALNRETHLGAMLLSDYRFIDAIYARRLVVEYYYENTNGILHFECDTMHLEGYLKQNEREVYDACIHKYEGKDSCSFKFDLYEFEIEHSDDSIIREFLLAFMSSTN